MDHRHLAPLLTGIALASLSVPVVGQTQTGAADIPRLADGRPDLRGVWDFRTLTPLQRPTELADKGFFYRGGSRRIRQPAGTRIQRRSQAGENRYPDAGRQRHDRHGGSDVGLQQLLV